MSHPFTRRVILSALSGLFSAAALARPGFMRGGVGASVSVQTVIGVPLSNQSFIPDGINPVDVGDVSVRMNPISPAFSGVITLGGANAADFQITNAGVLPCKVQAKAATGVGDYSITLTADPTDPAIAPLTTLPLGISGTDPNAALVVTRQFNQPAGTTTPAIAFWYMGHPCKKAELGGAEHCVATLGGTPVRVGAVNIKLEADGSQARFEPLVDFSGVSITPGASQDLVFQGAVGAWSTTCNRTDADWIALADTIEITSLATTGTPAADMDGAGTWVADFASATGRVIEIIGTCPVGRVVSVKAPFFNGGTQHAYLVGRMEYIVYEKADTTLGPIASRGPFVENAQIFKSTAGGLNQPSEFDYSISWKRAAVAQRTEIGVKQIAMSIVPLTRIDGQWDWTANDPGVWVGADYRLTRKTLKIPTFNGVYANGAVVYTGEGASAANAAISSISAGGTFTISVVAAMQSLFGTQPAAYRPSAISFSATVMPSGLTAGVRYWAVRLTSTTFKLYDTLANAQASTATGQILPGVSFTALVARLCVGATTSGAYFQAMGTAGSRPDIGPMNEWNSQYHCANTQDFQLHARVQAYIFALIPMWTWNHLTGKIPSLLDAAGTPAGLIGSGQTGSTFTTTWYGGKGFSSWSTNINSGTGPTGGTNGWVWDAAHFTCSPYGVWLMEGGSVLRDLVILTGAAAVSRANYLPRRNYVYGGTTFYATACFNQQGTIERAGAWNLRDLTSAAFASIEGSPEETYFRRVLANNVAQLAAYRTAKGVGYERWGVPITMDYGYAGADQTKVGGAAHVHSFMHTYMVVAAQVSDLLQGDFVSGLGDTADFTTNLHIAYYTNPGTFCPYFGTPYNTQFIIGDQLTLNSAATYVAAVDDLAFSADTNTVSINATGDVVISPSGAILWPIAVNDQVRFCNYNPNSGVAGTAAPLPFVDGTDYHVVNLAPIRVAATQGGDAITPTVPATTAGIGAYWKPTGQSCPSSGTVSGAANAVLGDTYLGQEVGALGLAVVRGVANADDALVAALAQATGNSWDRACMWNFQATI